MDGHDRSISDISKIINSHKWDQVGAWDQVDALFHFLEADSDPPDPRPGHDAMAVLILQHIHQISHHRQVRIKLNLPQKLSQAPADLGQWDLPFTNQLSQ